MTHEKLHVQDNLCIVKRSKQSLKNEAIRGDGIWKMRFLDRKWIPQSGIDEQEERLVQTIVKLFQNKAKEATGKRDTPAEYRRVKESIQKQSSEGSGGRRSTGYRLRTTGCESHSPGR